MLHHSLMPIQLLLLWITLSTLILTIEARYLWHPDEGPQPMVHNFSPSIQGEHHILNLGAAPEPVFPNTPISSKSTEETSTKKDHSSTALTTHSDPKPTPHSDKPATPPTPVTSPSSKDTKPLAATHSVSTKSAAIKGSDSSSPPLVATPIPSPSSSLNPISPSITTSPSSSSSNDSGGSGAVAGIVIAVIAIVGAITAFVMIRKKKQTRRDVSPDPFTMGFGSHDPTPSIYNSNSHQYNNNNDSINNNNSGMVQPYYQEQPMAQAVHMSPISPTAYPPNPPITTYPQQVQQDIPQGSLGVFNVVSTYAPTLSDEIDIQLGDHIEILVEYDDGWCQGVNLTRGNAKGVFPRHCVEQYPGEQQQQLQLDGPPQLELGNMNRVSSMYMTHT
ncbi:hypothetical protein BC941DRAFT_510912 [Chlamydoabsidia padenii]|nr:hypothetical protein BC941DRAFT_510912 [Chlamydoabsidia padenii]